MSVSAEPVLPALFVEVPAVVPNVIVDLRYAGPNNFVGVRVDGYEAERALLTRPAAEAAARVAEALARQGLVLKLLDCYRPTRAVAHFARWAADANDLGTKADFYPTMTSRSCSISAISPAAPAIRAARPST